MWNIRELSLRQKMFWPSFSAGLVIHLLVYLILAIGLNITWFKLMGVREPIEINLFRSFRQAKKKKAVPRGARKIVKAKEAKAVPREVVEEEVVRKTEVEDGGRKGTAFDAYLGSVYARIERRKYYPEIEKERYHEGVVKVGFVLKRDGTLGRAWVVKPCRHRGLNRAALQTVKRAAPFMPMPDQFKDDKLPVVIDIVYQIL